MKPANGLVKALARQSLLRQLLRPVFAVAATVVAGIVGFQMLAGIGPINALFWLFDPTSIELHYQNHDGPVTLVKAYAIVILSGLVISGAWTGETLIAALFGGELSEEVTRMQMKQKIDDQEDHVIICGYGTFGKTIARRLQETETAVVVVEQTETEYQRGIEDGILTIQGDARQEELLLDAGVKRAATVIGAIDDTNVNVKIAVTASQLAPTVRVIVRAGDRMDEAVARRVGADDVVVPEVVSAEQVCTNLS